jgi:hypothetical protein
MLPKASRVEYRKLMAQIIRTEASSGSADVVMQGELDALGAIVTSHTGVLNAHTTSIGDNAFDIAALDGQVTSNTADIATNTSTIASMYSLFSGQISSNSDDIATNTSTIASMYSLFSGQIDANTADIATNASDISALVAEMALVRAALTPMRGYLTTSGLEKTIALISGWLDVTSASVPTLSAVATGLTINAATGVFTLAPGRYNISASISGAGTPSSTSSTIVALTTSGGTNVMEWYDTFAGGYILHSYVGVLDANGGDYHFRIWSGAVQSVYGRWLFNIQRLIELP